MAIESAQPPKENPGEPLKRQMIAAEAARLGEGALRLWNKLERKAEEETANRG